MVGGWIIPATTLSEPTPTAPSLPPMAVLKAPPIMTTFRGCRCGRVVIAPDNRPGLWCPSAVAGVHGWLTPYPF